MNMPRAFVAVADIIPIPNHQDHSRHVDAYYENVALNSGDIQNIDVRMLCILGTLHESTQFILANHNDLRVVHVFANNRRITPAVQLVLINNYKDEAGIDQANVRTRTVCRILARNDCLTAEAEQLLHAMGCYEHELEKNIAVQSRRAEAVLTKFVEEYT